MLVKFSALFSAFFYISICCFGQNTYNLSYATDIPIGAIAIGTNIPPLFLKKNKPVLTEPQIQELNANHIWKLDRFVTKQWNTKAAISSDVFMIGSMVLPSLLLINKQVRSEAGVITLMYAETWLLNAGITNLTKELFKRKRPFVYNPNAPLSKKMKADATSSFFSGHTSFAASSSFFMAKVYADTNPNSRYKPYVWSAAATIPLTTAILRIIAGKHFPTDVFVGYIIGATTGILVPHLHRPVGSRGNPFRVKQ